MTMMTIIYYASIEVVFINTKGTSISALQTVNDKAPRTTGKKRETSACLKEELNIVCTKACF